MTRFAAAPQPYVFYRLRRYRLGELQKPRHLFGLGGKFLPGTIGGHFPPFPELLGIELVHGDAGLLIDPVQLGVVFAALWWVCA